MTNAALVDALHRVIRELERVGELLAAEDAIRESISYLLEQGDEVSPKPAGDTKEPPEHQEPQTFCDSCWWYTPIQNNRSAAVMYCNYHDLLREECDICDWYEDAESGGAVFIKMKSEER